MSRRKTSFDASPSAPTNDITVSVTLAVDLREIASWPPQTARAFMLGLAQVVSAHEQTRRDLTPRTADV